MNDIFRFHLDADIEKSDSSSPRIIRGYASTDSTDRQGESLLQKGLDISDFVNHGFFNYDHNNSIILGYPYPTCHINDKGFWVEGELLKGIPESDHIWDLAIALKKSNAPRKIGFSVEGKVLQRGENGRVMKARIYNVAITTNPVNTDCTWDAIVKSFTDLSQIVNKSLEAGYEVNPLEMEGGGVFRKEDLDNEFHNLSYVIDNEENKKILKQRLLTKKSFSNNELILYLQLTEGWSQEQARNFITKKIQ